MKNSELKRILIAEDGPYCWNCNFHQDYPDTSVLDLHHVIIHDSKRFHDEVTNKYNCCLVCRFCHPHCNGHEFRVRFWEAQIKKHGKEVLRDWLTGLSPKIVLDSVFVKMVTEPYDKKEER